MSRGYGKLQRFWIQIAAHNDNLAKPWTFAEICRSAFEVEEADMTPAIKRSLRRALQGLVKDKMIICLGTRKGAHGRRGYFPARYILNPTLLKPDDPRVAAICEHLARCGLSVHLGR
jgi:hypothetical protein